MLSGGGISTQPAAVSPARMKVNLDGFSAFRRSRLHRVRDRIRDGDMPPGEAKVSAEELNILERWISAGAATARVEPETIGPGLPILPEDRQWWAFQRIQRPAIGQFAADARIRTPVDALLVEAMPAGLSFSPDADKHDIVTPNDFQATLMRQFCLDHSDLTYTHNGQEQKIANNRPARVVSDIIDPVG